MSILGENLKALRERAKMTQADLSKVSGIGKSTISEIESGKAQNSKNNTVAALAKALNVSVETLTGMEIEHEYIITDVEEAMNVVLSQDNLMLNGEALTDEAKIQLANSIKMALQFTKETQKRNKK